MKKSYSESYKNAGVDITAGYKSVEMIKSFVESTKTEGVLSSIGGFGGLFEPDLKNIKNPVFVSGTDGVGTKLKIAFLMDKHDTIGIDCVAMCVNDIICAGAKPLFFLDYIACGKNIPKKIAEIVKGVANGCMMSGAALVGGETAEHPNMMPSDEYDIAGFSVGIVDKSKILDKNNVCSGDILIAIASSGVHSNGFSLIRKIFDIDNADINKHIDFLGKSLGEELLTPTNIYVNPILSLNKNIKIKSISHITGGGFYENIPRAIPNGLTAYIDKSKLNILPIFEYIQKSGNISEHDMFNTFNMGVGISIIVSAEDVNNSINILKSFNLNAYVIGEIKQGENKIEIC